MSTVEWLSVVLGVLGVLLCFGNVWQAVMGKRGKRLHLTDIGVILGMATGVSKRSRKGLEAAEKSNLQGCRDWFNSLAISGDDIVGVCKGRERDLLTPWYRGLPGGRK